MLSSRTGLTSGSSGRRRSVLAGMAILGLVASTGCQVEYAGMTLPSGKYMYDDVQYFAPGPEFPYANTQAATQRARMATMGMPVPPPAIYQGPGAAGIMAPGVIPGVPSAGGGALPRPTAAPEIENSMPGGASAPNMSPPGGTTPPPPPQQ